MAGGVGAEHAQGRRRAGDRVGADARGLGHCRGGGGGGGGDGDAGPPLSPAAEAVTVTVPRGGRGRDSPAWLTVPPAAPETDQTKAGGAVRALPNWSLATAANCWLAPSARVAAPGDDDGGERLADGDGDGTGDGQAGGVKDGRLEGVGAGGPERDRGVLGGVAAVGGEGGRWSADWSAQDGPGVSEGGLARSIGPQHAQGR